jgi:hypothetical protein
MTAVASIAASKPAVLYDSRTRLNYTDRLKPLRLPVPWRSGDNEGLMEKQARRQPPRGQDLISLAQQLARDAERHAILSASLASQADRLMVAGLKQLERRTAAPGPRRDS